MGRSGFTLTEILVSITLVGILAAAALVNYTKAIRRARWDIARQVLIQIYDGEMKYYNTVSGNTIFHVSINTAGAPCLGGGGPGTCVDDWRDNLFMDNPNEAVGQPVTYSIGFTPTGFLALATFGPAGSQTIDENRQLCPTPPGTAPGPGCLWTRP